MGLSITIYSNFLNHHQIPFCNEMYQKLGGKFWFVSTEKIPKERLDLGYRDFSQSYPYNINSYENQQSFKKAMVLGKESDIVIIGSAPDLFIRNRIKDNKLTFRYSERLFKKGSIRLLDPRVLFDCLKKHTRLRNKKVHMLCASGYTSFDASILRAYANKCWKWGYFTEVYEYDIENIISLKPSESINILWAGRFINWKHPEQAIKVARMLNDKNYNFSLNLIGTGEELNGMKKLAAKYNLEQCVNFLGAMSPDEVRRHMLKANIFLFTSDRQEGWGVVLNEAMNSGCAVVANNSPGAVPYLISDQHNGLIYKSGNLKDFFEKVETLVTNTVLRNFLGKNAYTTMIYCWTPKVAADRLCSLSNSILGGNEIQYESGPCTKAEIIRG